MIKDGRLGRWKFRVLPEFATFQARTLDSFVLAHYVVNHPWLRLRRFSGCHLSAEVFSEILPKVARPSHFITLVAGSVERIGPYAHTDLTGSHLHFRRSGLHCAEPTTDRSVRIIEDTR